MTYDEANAKLVLLTDELTDLLSGLDSTDKLSTTSLANIYSQESGTYNINKEYMPGTLVVVGAKYYRCLLKNRNIYVLNTTYWIEVVI